MGQRIISSHVRSPLCKPQCITDLQLHRCLLHHMCPLGRIVHLCCSINFRPSVHSIFLSAGQKWKEMRNTLSPAFTSSKMKFLFTLVSETGQQLSSHLEDCLRKQQATAEHKSVSQYLYLMCDYSIRI
jgi:hypothetical protein